MATRPSSKAVTTAPPASPLNRHRQSKQRPSQPEPSGRVPAVTVSTVGALLIVAADAGGAPAAWRVPFGASQRCPSWQWVKNC
ncbi:hypothetical protein ACP4OV_017384 [Aristida adscensionis]